MTCCALCRQEIKDDGSFTVDLNTNQILAGRTVRQASPMVAEFAAILAKHRPNAVQREPLMNGLYGLYVDDPPDSHILNVYAHRLRHLLIGTGFSVETYHGTGFRIASAEDDGLSVNERQVIDYIRAHHEEHGAWPRQAKVWHASPYSNRNTFYAALNKLQGRGRIHRADEGVNRRVEVIEKGSG
jgi:DNA-binding winged helix-turn-helix (wHTH) protein